MPTSTYVALATETLSGTATDVTFSSIPATYRDLILVFAGEGTNTVQNTYLRFNSDTGSNYSNVDMQGNGSSASSVSATTTGAWFLITGETLGQEQSNAISQIMDYSATDKHTTLLTRANSNNPTGATVDATASRWANTSAVTSVQVFVTSGSFAAGCTFSLYGIEA